jgi:hypothetical protein
MKKEEWLPKFLNDLNDYIIRLQINETANSLNCGNCFNNLDSYENEKIILKEINESNYRNTKEQGDALERLVKSLFKRIPLIYSVELTGKSIDIGQTDIQLYPIADSEVFYGIWGIKDEKPKSIIGECKNHPKQNVNNSEIEKMCWRTCKSGSLTFFVGFDYSEDALNEIAYFNEHKDEICHKTKGSLIVPLNFYMLEAIIKQNINFCYFINWAILLSPKMSIKGYIYQFASEWDTRNAGNQTQNPIA